MNGRLRTDRTDAGTRRRYLRPLLGALLLLAAFCTAMAAGLPPAGADTVTVTANPLWTDTGITLMPQDARTIHGASGSWNWGTFYSFGPDGDYQPGFTWDEWITNGQHGQLIGFIGADPYSASQNDSRLFPIGTGTVNLCGLTGHLWLGFNDDFASGAVDDNSGSVTVQVDPTYQIQLLYDSSKSAKSGSTVPIKIQVLNWNGNNISSSSLVVHALRVVMRSGSASSDVVDAGNANPDSDFRYDANLAGYIFNLKTTGLTTGTYDLYFTVGGCGELSVPFQVR
jgi:hypothetical protein